MERDEKLESIKVVEVIKVEIVRGTGENENPVRQVNQYWDFEGNLIYDDNIMLVASSKINS